VTEVTAFAPFPRESESMIQIGAAPATIDTPIEHLQACHRRIEQRLATLVKAGDLLATDRDTALTAIAKSLAFLDSSGALHTADEEESLFPRLRAKLPDVQIQVLDTLEAQHLEASGIHEELRRLVGLLSHPEGDPDPLQTIARYRDRATRLETFYQAHIQIEDHQLAPLATLCLTASEVAEIADEMHFRRRSRPSTHQ